MRLVGLKILHEFCKKHPDCRTWIESWISDVRASQWNSLNELKDRYPTASILANSIIIFNVKGNCYRMSVQVAVSMQIVAIKWIGTHSDYSRRSF